MPGPRHRGAEAAEALVTVAPLVSRWIDRLLASHEPPLTVTQFLALRAIAEQTVSGSELARRAGVSGPAVSQLLAGLADANLLERAEVLEDRRRQALALTTGGEKALASAHTLLRERLSALLAELPGPEAHALARALPRVAATLSGAPPPRRPPGPKHAPPPHSRPGSIQRS
jgi:DNA-binding MarR family transcriptional regulator